MSPHARRVGRRSHQQLDSVGAASHPAIVWSRPSSLASCRSAADPIREALALAGQRRHRLQRSATREVRAGIHAADSSTRSTASGGCWSPMPRAARDRRSRTSSLASSARSGAGRHRGAAAADDAQGARSAAMWRSTICSYQFAGHDLLHTGLAENIAGKLRILLNVSRGRSPRSRTPNASIGGSSSRSSRAMSPERDAYSRSTSTKRQLGPRQGLRGSQDGAQSTVEGSQP